MPEWRNSLEPFSRSSTAIADREDSIEASRCSRFISQVAMGGVTGQITVMRAENAESYPLDGAARLYRNLDGVRAAA